jgi:hypothetical protein
MTWLHVARLGLPRGRFEPWPLNSRAKYRKNEMLEIASRS